MGKQLLILTSRTHTELQHMLEPDHHLSGRVANFYYKDVMRYHKPDPRAFGELLRDNHLRPAEAIYVGDSITDAQAAKGAGLLFVASLESGLRTKADFAGQPVDTFIESFPEIVAAVQSFDGAATGVQE
jgi:phosphoglycolate phosphatase